MMTRARGTILASACLICICGDLPAAAAGPMKTFSIAIDGSEGVQVVAACLVDWGDAIDVLTVKGDVPQRRTVDAVGISCQIQRVGRSGRMVVEIKKDGRVVSRNASSGSSSVISISLQ